ncbi:MAG: TRAP transporter small permease [Desulfovibrionaceae bacterium]|nr:TRAP transporter small permease [Desulfovibrionaceae bacterium]
MLKSFFKCIDRLTEICIVISFTILCAVIFAQVITRYFLSFSLPWAEEVGRFLFLALSYLGVSIGMKRHGHLRMDIVIMYMPKNVQYIFDLINKLITIGFFLFIVYIGINMTMRVYRIDQMAISIPLPIWIVWACIPFTACLSALQGIRDLIELCTGVSLRETGGAA